MCSGIRVPPHARSRRRHPHRPGVAWSRLDLDDPDLHQGHDRASREYLSLGPSPGGGSLMGGTWHLTRRFFGSLRPGGRPSPTGRGSRMCCPRPSTPSGPASTARTVATPCRSRTRSSIGSVATPPARAGCCLVARHRQDRCRPRHVGRVVATLARGRRPRHGHGLDGGAGRRAVAYLHIPRSGPICSPGGKAR